MAKKPEPQKKKKKDKSTKNAILAFLFAMIALCGLFGAHKASNFMICGLLSAFIALVIKIATTPMKGIEAPGNSAGIIVEDIEDEFAHNMIATGLTLLEELGRERDAIGENIFTKRINDFITVFKEMLGIVNRDYSKASYLRKMNTYYIPTIIKLLAAYREAKAQGTSYMEINTHRDRLLKTLDQLVRAARNVKKKMVKSNLERADITREVLDETLMADGYIETEEVTDLRESAAAAAREMPMVAQMGAAVRAAMPAQQPRPEAKAEAPAATPAPAPVRTAVPGVTMDPTMAPRQATPAPSIPANMPTASAQQLQTGAPVLDVPGLFEEAEGEQDDQQTMMF